MDSRVYRDGKPVPIKTTKVTAPLTKRAGESPHHMHPVDMSRKMLVREVLAWRGIALAYRYDPETDTVVER